MKDNLGVCLLIGDTKDEILKGIGSFGCSLEQGGLSLIDEDGDARSFGLPIDTKYYTADATLWSMPSFSSIKPWEASHIEENVCSLVIFIKDEKDLSHLQELSVYCQKWDAEVKVLVYNGELLTSESAKDRLTRWTIQENFDFINLHPDSAEMEDLTEFNEKVGIERVFELITTANWPGLKHKPDPTKRPEQQRRLRRLIDDETPEPDQHAEYSNSVTFCNFTAENIGNMPILIPQKPPGEKKTTKDLEIQEKLKGMIELTLDDLPNKEDEAQILKAFMNAPRTITHNRDYQMCQHHHHPRATDASNTILFFHPANTLFQDVRFTGAGPYFAALNNEFEEHNQAIFAKTQPFQFIRAHPFPKEPEEAKENRDEPLLNEPLGGESKKAKKRKQKKARQKERAQHATESQDRKNVNNEGNFGTKSSSPTETEMKVFNRSSENKNSSVSSDDEYEDANVQNFADAHASMNMLINLLEKHPGEVQESHRTTL